MATVLIAPDSFKGSVAATDVADAMATGWLSVRPHDTVLIKPMADGGEGTLDCVEIAHQDATRMTTEVTGPNGRAVQASWLLLPNGTAVIELAQTSGLPLMEILDPLGATTRGLGELIALAGQMGAKGIVVALGGSATNDAGIGALEALGVIVSREDDQSRGALGVTSIDTSSMVVLPEGGIQLLVDTRVAMVDAPTIFGPQKGATPADIDALERAFGQLVALAGSHSAHQQPGSGAAGGTAWGLATYCNAEIVLGAESMAKLTGVDEAISGVDFVLTGEGKFDATSLTGKVVGELGGLARRHGTPGGLIVGTSDGSNLDGWPMVRLVDLAGSDTEALSNARKLISEAAGILAERF